MTISVHRLDFVLLAEELQVSLVLNMDNRSGETGERTIDTSS
jgi:hypothetical protein